MSVGPVPGIEPVTSRSAVKGSTNWANPAALKFNSKLSLGICVCALRKGFHDVRVHDLLKHYRAGPSCSKDGQYYSLDKSEYIQRMMQ